MNLENFKTYLDLVDFVSFSKAAKKNGVSQSAISQQLRAMEKHFDVLLVDRKHKKFHLTSQGKITYKYCKKLLAIYDELKLELKEHSLQTEGKISISTMHSIGLGELAYYSSLYKKSYPDVNLSIEYEDFDDVYQSVLSSKVEMGLVCYPKYLPELEVDVFKEDDFVLICSLENPLAKRAFVEVKDISNYNYISFDTSNSMQIEIEKELSYLGASIKKTMQFDSVEAIKRAVQINAGVSIVPRSSVSEILGTIDIASLNIKDFKAQVTLAVIRKNGERLGSLAEDFISFLKKV